ncbi:TPA: LysR family transcriptional regulator [Pseudomonas aeruginosa]
MELRHLRCFLAVAEELHFARAAERLHIEQSPLSRTIKELEADLGAVLFERSSRSTRLTPAGAMLLSYVPRIFSSLEQARNVVKSVAAGFQWQLRVAFSDGITPYRLSAILAQCREEDPDVDIRLYEVPLANQIKGLRDDLYDVGFAQSSQVGDGILAEHAWSDPLVIAIPKRHPLLSYKRVPLHELIRYPLVMRDPRVSEGNYRQVMAVLNGVGYGEPLIAEEATTMELLFEVVAAGYALALVGASQMNTSQNLDVTHRPLAGRAAALTTYLLRVDKPPSATLGRFIERVGSLQNENLQATSSPHIGPTTSSPTSESIT